PHPLCLLAPRNPIEMAGTFPLPEAQLDRFLVRVSLGYPDDATEARVMKAQRQSHPIDALAPVADVAQLAAAQDEVSRVFIHDSLVRYVQRIVAESVERVEVPIVYGPA